MGQVSTGTAAGREQSQARYPDDAGHLDRDGVRIWQESYGSGEPVILLMPTWEIAHSQAWKGQIPVTSDGAARAAALLAELL